MALMGAFARSVVFPLVVRKDRSRELAYARRYGRMQFHSPEQLAEYRLDAPPVFDGLAAAGGQLYLATMDGKVACFGGK